MRSRMAWIILVQLVLAGGARAANFTFTCGDDRFVAKPAGQDHVFQAPIAAIPPGNDDVEVIFEPHIPDTWFAQWCQVSTGSCFVGSATITLTAGQQDRLDIDVFVQGDLTPQYGWIDVTVRSVADPLQTVRCTYTLFSGLPLPPAPVNVIDCTDNTRQLTVPADVDFYNPIENATGQPDTLIVTMTTSAPQDWFAQFCQVSTGICYFDRGELSLAAGQQDQIHLQVFPGAGPSQGAFDLYIQSKRNPSIANLCLYRVYVGQGLTEAGEAAGANPLAVRIVPNPSSGEAAILLRGEAGSEGSLSIFAADGRLVRAFPALELGAGARELRWDGLDRNARPVPSGAYFYRLVSGGRELRGLIVRTR